MALSVTGGIPSPGPIPTCALSRCVPVFLASVQRALATPSESVRAEATSTDPPSTGVQRTGTSGRARPVESVMRTATESESSSPAWPLKRSTRGVTLVLLATGSASARMASALSTFSTVANSVCRPGSAPSVQVARARPSASVTALAGSTDPSPSARRKVTLLLAAGAL